MQNGTDEKAGYPMTDPFWRNVRDGAVVALALYAWMWIASALLERLATP